MPRPRFQLSDTQAALIAQGVARLDATIPRDARSHRPFVREFIKVVHTATGKLYSPEIYRRLMDAYAPTRRPSVATLASEREHAGMVLNAATTSVGDDSASAPRVPVLADLADVVAAAIDAKLGAIVEGTSQLQNAQLDFYQHQLQQAETELRQLRARVATLATELAVARQSAEQYRVEAAAAREQNVKHAQTFESMTGSADEMRKFALMSIEDARGEVRTWKDRCAEMEIQRHRDAQALEAMRRANFKAATTTITERDK